MTLRLSRLSLLATAGTFAAASASAQVTLLSDDFEVDTSANYTIVTGPVGGTPDGSQEFAFDYVAGGIPLAPRSATGDTGALRIEQNMMNGAIDSSTVFHNMTIDEDQYKLTVDVWMNYLLNGSGTTEHAHIGVGGDGLTPNQYAIPTSGSGAYLVFTGEGGSASDYRWYRDASNLPAGEVDSGSLPATHPSYLAGGTNASLPFYQALFPSPPAATPGSPGLMWTTVEIEVDQTAGTIKMSMDGTLIIDGAFAGDLSGLVSLGLADIFTSLSGPTNFILYDNLTVETNPTFLGQNYCIAATNSTGSIGSMSAIGSPIASQNSVLLMASDMPTNQFGIFVTSRDQGFVMGAGGTSNGNLCLSGTLGRFSAPSQILTTGGSGSFDLAIDLTMVPEGGGFASVMAGETWNFQAWHRDTVGLGSNFTEGLEIIFQ